MHSVESIAAEIVRREGGYVYDPDDPGGATKHGVTLGTLKGLKADLNRDGRVDLADFGALKAHFGLPGTLREGEFTRDRQIDLADFGVLKANFGRSAAAPEPSALALALAGLAAVCMGSNWRRAGWRGRRAPFQR